MAPQDFYNTYDPAQAKFNWGGGGFQTGPVFDPVAYNQAYASDTPWGLQQMARPLTAAQMADIVAGRPYVAGPIAAQATRREAYNPASMAGGQNVYQVPRLGAGSQGTTTTTPVGTTTPVNTAQQALIVKQLGADWMQRQQAAAAAGDWATYNQIQSIVNSIINPIVEQA
jgi:hypothetical protein